MAGPSLASLIEPASLGLVALATGGVALLVFLAHPGKGWNQWLAFFLILVSGNFALDAVVSASRLDSSLLVAVDASRLVSLQFLLLAVDPLALVYFASIFPRRSGPARSPLALSALAAATALFLVVEVTTGALSDTTRFRPARAPFFLYVHACYLYACLRLVESALSEPSRVMAQQVRLVALGVLVAMLPRVALVGVDLARHPLPIDLDPSPLYAAEVALRITLLWGLYAGIRTVARRRPAVSDDRRAEVLSAMRPYVWVAGGLTAVWLPMALLQSQALGPAVVVRGLGVMTTFGLRWLPFCAAMILGIVRYQLLEGSRRAVLAPTAITLAIVAFGGVALTAPRGGWEAAAVGAVVAGAGAVAAFALARPAGISPYVRDRQLEAYRSLLAAALAEGPLEGDRHASVEAARRKLGVSKGEHDALLAIALAEEPASRSVATDAAPGRYEILRPLGVGGYATVHLARDRTAGGLVVLKRIHETAVGEAAALDAALREMAVARRVSHPNLVAIHAVERLPDGALVVLEYAEGGSLAGRIAVGPLDGSEARRLAEDVLAGLAALHDADLVHGDVKPDNVLLARDGRAMLADFGLARAASGRTLASVGARGVGGTLAYLAPEVVRGAAPSKRSDVFGVAACLRDALGGPERAPAPGATLARLAAEPTPPALRAAIAKGLAERPDERFADAGAMLAAIRAA